MFILNGNVLPSITGVRILDGLHESFYSDQVCTPRVAIHTTGGGIELFDGNNAECALDELLRCGIYNEQQHQQAVIVLRDMQDDFGLSYTDNELHKVTSTEYVNDKHDIGE